MLPLYDYGTDVRLVRNVRNDGTYPGKDTGELLVRRGQIGSVCDVGTFLQDQLIYRVHFLTAGCTVGCREQELIPATDPWLDNRFEFRDKVIAKKILTIGDQVVAALGATGEIERVIKDTDKVLYHTRFGGRTLLVPETSLEAVGY
jgi:nitrogen fixation protein NifZ